MMLPLLTDINGNAIIDLFNMGVKIHFSSKSSYRQSTI